MVILVLNWKRYRLCRRILYIVLKRHWYNLKLLHLPHAMAVLAPLQGSERVRRAEPTRWTVPDSDWSRCNQRVRQERNG